MCRKKFLNAAATGKKFRKLSKYDFRFLGETEVAYIKQITEEISEVEITKAAVHLIHNKAKSFRQIVNTIDAFEKVAQANGLTKIDENIAQEILNG